MTARGRYVTQQKQVSIRNGLMETAMIKEMHSIGQEGDIRTIKVRKT